MRHPSILEEFGMTPEEFGRRLSGTRYDDLRDSLYSLSRAIGHAAADDEDDGKMKLSDALYRFADKLGECGDIGKEIWDICEPYMDNTK